MSSATRRGPRFVGHVSLALLVAGLAPAPIRAEEKVTCVQSAERAQGLRAQGKLVAARRNLETCAGASCPGVVRSDCQVWLREVEALLPTLAVSALDEAGAPLPEATVVIDNETRTLRPGEVIALDPGPHWVEVAAPGRARIKEFVTLTAGAGSRPLVVKLPPVVPPPAAEPLPAAPAPVAPAAPAPAPAPAVASARRAEPSHAPAWVLGGLVVTGAVAFGVLGISGYRDAEHLRSTCAPHCAPADVSGARRKLVLADVSLAVALLSGGLWLAFGGTF